ncbi:hypothetical protein CHUAL_013410 [Chamberlinius hualienensis]
MEAGASAVCGGCMNVIEDDEYLQALSSEWHTECFRCSVCDVSLSTWYFEKDGLLFCKTDYWSKFGEACQNCGEIITGPVMVAGEHKFHPECFRCFNCSTFIGDGESYALIERSKLYCGACYKKQMQPIIKYSPFVKQPHSIQLVEIPATQNRQRGIKLSLDPRKGVIKDVSTRGVHISELDVNPDLMALHIGDKILEVNGTPVKDQSLSEIEEIIRNNTNKMLQLTIEHDPTALGRQRSFPQSLAKKEPRECLFKKRDDSHCSSTSSNISTSPANSRSRQLKRGKGCKERSSSLPKVLASSSDSSPGGRTPHDLSRTKSFRVEHRIHRIFRASDLVQGELLAKGFFGQVYKVTQRETGEVMVLKELYRVDEEAQKNFLKEVAVLKSLSHENVLQFIGVLYRERKLHLITEYISGGTLKRMIHDVNETLPWEQRINFARDIANGMSYLHSMNIIHRDLNSNNCLVRENRTVVVADFGLARIINDHQGNASGRRYGNNRCGKKYERKKRYTVVGNPYWMAPEMMKGKKYDERVDIFSYGIILCELIGRVNADPDYLPRSPDFGLNTTVFKEKFCNGCPELFYKVAFLCCDLDAEKRPQFEIIEPWFSGLTMHIAVGKEIPEELQNEILNYSSRSSPPSPSEAPAEMENRRAQLVLRTISEGSHDYFIPHSPPDSPIRRAMATPELDISSDNAPP